MVASPYSIDPTTYLDKLLAQASPDLMHDMLKGSSSKVPSTQTDQVCGTNYATASASRVDVAVPKLRTGSFFPDWLLERRARAE